MDIGNYCPKCMSLIPQGGVFCPSCGKNLNEKTEVKHQLAPFSILQGKYLIGEVMGEGGFGITYIGLDLNLRLRLAIKEFYPNGYAYREGASTTNVTLYEGNEKKTIEKWRDGFIKEAQALAKCQGLPGVVGVRDFFRENETAYIVMEYLEGKQLRS